MKLKKIAAFMLIPAFFAACNGKDSDYNATPTGLLYRNHIKNEGNLPKIGDFLSLDVTYSTEKDSIIFDSRITGTPLIIKLSEPEYEGDIAEGFAMMSKGDSSSFIVDAEKFFKNNVKIDLPEFLQPGNRLKFEVKVRNIQTMEDLMKEQEATTEKNRSTEQEQIKNYLSENKIVQAPTPNGLYYIETKKGNGIKAENGKMVKVNYTGMLLDGTVFDTSIEETAKNSGLYNPQRPYAPLDFQLGAGMVIQGWEEGVSYMNAGGKATFIIPSHLAYGERGAGGMIPPHATLIFEVELKEVN